MSSLTAFISGNATKKTRKDNPNPQSAEKQPPKKRVRKTTKVDRKAIENNPALLDMSSEPFDGEVDCTDSDEDSDSDDESICVSINGSTTRRLSIQTQAENANMDVDEDMTKRYVSFEAVLRYLIAPPDLYLEEEVIANNDADTSRSTDEQIMREALDLQTSQLSQNSKLQYKSHMKKFVKFCRDMAIGDLHGKIHRYDVTEVKVLRFLMEVMFKSTTKKYFHEGQSRDVHTPFMFKSANTKGHAPTLGEVLRTVEPDKKGRRALDVPCGHQTMENVVKALCYVQQRQGKRQVRPNTEPDIRRSTLIRNAVEKYTNDLVCGILTNHKDLSAECEIRRAYTTTQHIQCLLYTWARPIAILSPWTREHLALAIRHSMLLRNEDLVHLNLADCFMMQIENRQGGSQSVSALVCAMHRGKTNKSGHTQYGCALRHHDVRRCSIGAFAFYMFDRFHNKEEPPPDVNDPDFPSTKVLLGKKGTPSSRLIPLSYAASRETTLKTFEAQQLECAQITHASRHSGAVEAQRLGVRPEDIKLGGRWVRGSGRMDQHYLSNVPIQFAFGMAGFKEGKPFHLQRNEKAPPIELQEMIFPFIETAFGEPGSEANMKWRQDCLDEMNEKDGDQPTQLEDIAPLDPPEPESGKRPVHEAHFAMNKKRFFKLLLRLRRVLLQDAVVYLHTYRNVKSPLLEHDIFKSELFLRFQNELAPVLDQGDLILPVDLPPIVANAVASQSQQQSSQYQHLLEQIQGVGLQVQQLQVGQHGPTDLQVQQQPGQEEAFRRYVATELNTVKQSLQELFLWVQGGHPFQQGGPSLGAAGAPPSVLYPPYAIGEQYQHHTTIYQSTARVPWLGPVSPLPPILPAQPEAPFRPLMAASQPTSIAPTRPTFPWNTPEPLALTAAPRTSTVQPVMANASTSDTSEGATSEESGSAFGFLQRPANTRQIFDERQRYNAFQDEYRKKNGKSAKVVEKTRKALNNRLRIIEEIEFRAKQARAENQEIDQNRALEEAMNGLDSLHLSCNELHKYCVKQGATRTSRI